MFMAMNKAQMEMMGLAVIVILLAMGMFFMTKFSLTPAKASTEELDKQEEMTTTFTNTMLGSDANCSSPITFGRLIDEMTDSYTSIYCGQDELIVHFNNSVRYLLNKTLDQWDYKYNLTIDFPSATGLPQYSIDHGCVDTQQEKTAFFPIPSKSGGTIFVKMKVCV
jgi:hypothetical protein